MAIKSTEYIKTFVLYKIINNNSVYNEGYDKNATTQDGSKDRGIGYSGASTTSGKQFTCYKIVTGSLGVNGGWGLSLKYYTPYLNTVSGLTPKTLNKANELGLIFQEGTYSKLQNSTDLSSAIKNVYTGSSGDISSTPYMSLLFSNIPYGLKPNTTYYMWVVPIGTRAPGWWHYANEKAINYAMNTDNGNVGYNTGIIAPSGISQYGYPITYNWNIPYGYSGEDILASQYSGQFCDQSGVITLPDLNDIRSPIKIEKFNITCENARGAIDDPNIEVIKTKQYDITGLKFQLGDNGPYYSPGAEVSGITEETTFNLDWGTCNIISTYENNIIKDIPIPEAPGDYFIGWSLSLNGELLSSTASITVPTTIYAVWGDRPILFFDARGGTVGVEQQTVPSNQDTYIIDNIPRKLGCIFKGWALNKNGTNLVDSVNINQSTKVYASWANDYGVYRYDQFLCNDGQIFQAEDSELMVWDKIKTYIALPEAIDDEYIRLDISAFNTENGKVTAQILGA